MPQLQNLVIKDRAATPVSHTFTPRDILSGVGAVVESSGVPIGENRITLSLSKTSAGRFKPVLKGSFPIVQTQTINGVSTPVVVRTAYFELTLSFDGSSTRDERNNVVGLLQNSLDAAQALTTGVLVDLQGVY